jgi:hypothetical protein
MAQKTATKKTAKTAAPVAHAIPTPAGGQPGKLNLLKKFGVKPKPTSGPVKDRPKLDLPQDLQDALRAYAPLKELFDKLDARKTREAKELNKRIWEFYLKLLWNKKKAPETPEIKIRGTDGKIEVESQYVVQQGGKIKVKPPAVEDGEEVEAAFIKALRDAGLSKDDAENFVTKELDFTPQFRIEITELTMPNRPATEQSAAQKLYGWLNGVDENGDAIAADAPLVLTAAERETLREHVEKGAKARNALLAPQDFLDRVCDYVGDIDQLDAVLSMVSPQAFLTRTAFAPSLPAAEQNARLKKEAEAIIGVELG